jgi:hypothetical protein
MEEPTAPAEADEANEEAAAPPLALPPEKCECIGRGGARRGMNGAREAKQQATRKKKEKRKCQKIMQPDQSIIKYNAYVEHFSIKNTAFSGFFHVPSDLFQRLFPEIFSPPGSADARRVNSSARAWLRICRLRSFVRPLAYSPAACPPSLPRPSAVRHVVDRHHGAGGGHHGEK